MNKLIIIISCLLFSLVANAVENVNEVRIFPNNTYYGTITGINLPLAQIKIEEMPGGVFTNLLGAVLLKDKIVYLSPATVIRDKLNNNVLQGNLLHLYKNSVAIQPDFQGRAWVIWQLTPAEVDWVKENKLNYWRN